MIANEIDFFKGIDPTIMEKIVNICSEQNYTKDAVLFSKGDVADCLYILVEGTIKLVIENGGSITYSLSDPGEVFGWASMLESGLRTASGVCATNLKVVRIEKEKLDAIFNTHPEVGLMVLKRLAKVISERLSNAYRDLLSARGRDTTPSYG
jgi:CRP/FNR family cyclic AMP-dependent transcriptional regulator